VLIVPGSFAVEELSAAAIAFLTSQAGNTNLAMMSISSGVLPLAQAGILAERRVAGPPSLLPTLEHRFPGTNWQDSRWTRHGNIWSSSAAATAVEMVAAWMRQYFWDRNEAVECALSAAGVPRFDEE
jgi:transcriptional regulator GlxA family with amidase domain